MKNASVIGCPDHAGNLSSNPPPPAVTAPTSYLSVKILPTRVEGGASVNNAPTPEELRTLQGQVQDLFASQGITAYIHTHQLVKAS